MGAVYGAYLYSLESELGAGEDLVGQAILFEGLFSRQVCLGETHILDNRGVAAFLREYEKDLDRMLKELDSDEVPLLGVGSRRDKDILGLLDLWLAPKDTGYPNYFTSLDLSQNQELRKGYSKLKQPDSRRKRLYKVAGAEFQRHVERLVNYFQCESRTIVPRSGMPDATLYPAVRSEVEALLISGAVVRDEEKSIADAILKTTAEPGNQTRDKLHRAIYGMQQPRVHNRVVRQDHGTAAPDSTRDEWRFFVNSIWNHNLATNLGLRPTLNTDWWQVGRTWFSRETLRDRLNLRPTGKFSVPVGLHREFIDFEFVRLIRKLPEFRKSLLALERARDAGDTSALESAKQQHVTFLAGRLAEHLVRTDRRMLVGPTYLDVAVSTMGTVSLALGPVTTMLAISAHVPPGAAVEFGKDVMEYGHFATTCPEVFSRFPAAEKLPRIKGTDFKSIVTDLKSHS